MANRSHHFTGTVRAVVFESVGNKKPAKTSTSATRLFLNSETFPSVIQSVNTDGIFPSLFTDWIMDGKVFVGFYWLNYGRKVAVGNFDLKIPTENILSVNSLVFSEFLVVRESNLDTEKNNKSLPWWLGHDLKCYFMSSSWTSSSSCKSTTAEVYGHRGCVIAS
jgi:hypothetical protein